MKVTRRPRRHALRVLKCTKEGHDGRCLVPERTIELRQGQPPKDRLDTICHELIHYVCVKKLETIARIGLDIMSLKARKDHCTTELEEIAEYGAGVMAATLWKEGYRQVNL